MTVGERIKRRRIELGMTQDELAKKVGYKSRSSINKIELSRDLPLKKVSSFADALETDVSYLMGWKDIYIEANQPRDYEKQVAERIMAYAERIYKYDYKTNELVRVMSNNNELKELFEVAKDSDPENIKLATDLLIRLKK